MRFLNSEVYFALSGLNEGLDLTVLGDPTEFQPTEACSGSEAFAVLGEARAAAGGGR